MSQARAEGDAQTRQWLVATLDAADSDPLRKRVRRAMLDGDRKTLEALARAIDVGRQPPSFLLSLAAVLSKEGLQLLATENLATEGLADSIQLEWLRRIQREHPTDLWANEEL